MNIQARVCSSTIHRGGWANAGESPGPSCCCTFSSREILTFPAQPTFAPAFLSAGSVQFSVAFEDSKQQSLEKRKEWASHLLLLFPYLPPFLLSFPQHIGGGGWVHTVLSVRAHVIWLESQASRQYVQSHPVRLLPSMKETIQDNSKG